MDRVGTQPGWLSVLGKVVGSWGGVDPRAVAKLGQEARDKADRQRQESRRACELRRKMAGTRSGGQLDRLAEVLKRKGHRPGAMRRFLGSSEGRACMKLLGRLDDTIVEGQLRARGLRDGQIDGLRGHIFTFARSTIASAMDDAVKQAATELGRLIRDPDELVVALEGTSHKKRREALERLGIASEAARRIARSPRTCEAELAHGLKVSARNLETLRRECLMAMQDDTRALDLFASTQKGTTELRRALGVPSDGSFAGNCVDQGLAEARSSKEAEALVKKLAVAVASVVSGGILASIVTSAAPALDRLGEAKTSREVAEGGAVLGLTDRGAVEQARREERAAKKSVRTHIVAGAAVGLAGHGALALGNRVAPKFPEVGEGAQSLVEKVGSAAKEHVATE